jgi:hypothetical protein
MGGTMKLCNRFLNVQSSQFSQVWEGFESVVHIYPENYAGIGAAVSYLPGIKIGVPDNWGNEIPIVDQEDRFLETTKIVIHGMSQGLFNFVNNFLVRFPNFKMYGVWHGNLTQLAYEEERGLFLLFWELAKSKNFVKSTSIRFEQNNLLPKPWNGPILNTPPRFVLSERARTNSVALCPSWNDIRKNLIFNLAIGVSSKSLKSVHYYQDIGNINLILKSKKLQKISYKGTANHLKELSQCQIVLNATVIDCQPMVDLESLSTHTKLICSQHSPIEKISPHEIFDHIHVNPFDFDSAKNKMEALLSMDQQLWNDMCSDFLICYDSSARLSWERFIGL